MQRFDHVRRVGGILEGLFRHERANPEFRLQVQTFARQGRRLLSQYQQLRQEILTNRQLFPPSAPGPVDLHPQSDPESQMEPLENTPHDGQELETQAVDKIPVEAKLIVAAENHVIDPHSPNSANPMS